MMLLGLMLATLVLVGVCWWSVLRRPRPRRDIARGSVSEGHAARRRIVPVLVVSSLLLLPSSCAKAPPTLSPQGAAAFNALRVGHALDLIRDTANDANHQTPPLVSRADLLLVVGWHETAVKTIVAVPSGWKPTVLASLDELKGHLSPGAWSRIALYVSLVKTVISEVP